MKIYHKAICHLFKGRFYKIIIDLFCFYIKTINKKTIVFNMDSEGELQFFIPTLEKLIDHFKVNIVFFVVHPGLKLDRQTKCMFIRKVFFVDSFVLRFAWLRKRVSIYLNTELRGMPDIYSICLFHGQPSKGVTFPLYKVWEFFDALFLYGPLHRLAYEETVCSLLGAVPDCPEIFEIGYPKSDDLLNNKYRREEFLLQLGLASSRKTIIYAPAFNEGASLRVFGPAIIEQLCELPYNILAKLPIDCLQPLSNTYATGGVDWFQVLNSYSAKYKNFRLIYDLKIDPALAASDIMVTCISSVGFEFMAIGKPVIFFNTPSYFSDYLQKLFPDEDMEEWSQRNTVNGGKEWGVTIDRPEQLPKAIETILAYPDKYPPSPDQLRAYLLYNPGNASWHAAHSILSILQRMEWGE